MLQKDGGMEDLSKACVVLLASLHVRRQEMSIHEKHLIRSNIYMAVQSELENKPPLSV